MVFLSEILGCVKILNTKMHYHIVLYFPGEVSQLEKYGPYRNWTMDYKGQRGPNKVFFFEKKKIKAKKESKEVSILANLTRHASIRGNSISAA